MEAMNSMLHEHDRHYPVLELFVPAEVWALYQAEWVARQTAPDTALARIVHNGWFFSFFMYHTNLPKLI